MRCVIHISFLLYEDEDRGYIVPCPDHAVGYITIMFFVVGHFWTHEFLDWGTRKSADFGPNSQFHPRITIEALK